MGRRDVHREIMKNFVCAQINSKMKCFCFYILYIEFFVFFFIFGHMLAPVHNDFTLWIVIYAELFNKHLVVLAFGQLCTKTKLSHLHYHKM